MRARTVSEIEALQFRCLRSSTSSRRIGTSSSAINVCFQGKVGTEAGKAATAAHTRGMTMQITKADVERAREIVAASAPLVGQSGALADSVTFAVAQGIAEGREQGILLTTAANDP